MTGNSIESRATRSVRPGSRDRLGQGGSSNMSMVGGGIGFRRWVRAFLVRVEVRNDVVGVYVVSVWISVISSFTLY